MTTYQNTGDSLCTNCHEGPSFIIPRGPDVEEGTEWCRVCFAKLRPKDAASIAVQLEGFQPMEDQDGC